MVWPRNHRRQLPFGRRSVPFQTPPQLQQAPLELLRSHLYPVDPQQIAPAVQHAVETGYREVTWLPLAMGQQQWAKKNGFYPHQYGAVQAYQQVQEQILGDVPAMQTVRRQARRPWELPWEVMSRELQAQMDLSRGGAPIRYPLDRTIGPPMRWPSETFEAMDNWEMFAASQRARAQRDARVRAMRRLRELDREYGKWTDPRYVDQVAPPRRAF